ncbi:putative disease resistance RPP13-like protein 1 [Lactuca sativa]|uniref:NB-ARC domain-containing protein n=1 Tax=Lactuca sativa TaxID=4236 RepID=A0A9R1W4N3_LACSA|nr:putative disease resistance RPP13-like protein 1 [Lactuca sativa]KAJ0216387.1 hypothetical protein LSAT_V11C300145250 [Lactuca sativa]
MHREFTEESGATSSMVRKLIPTCCMNFSLSTKMHDKLDSITTNLQELVKEKNNLGLRVKGESPRTSKRFLLVLDDVWSESYTEWEILERPFLSGAPGSKIIVTTRKFSLLTQLGYSTQAYSLSVLTQESALSLFAQHAFGESSFDSHPTLKSHGEGIVEKCDGLPLALIALGRLLRTKTNEEEWKELLDSEIWRLGKRDEIIPALRLSYHDLSTSLKHLFAYCSLFPKDYVFDMEELILLWMAEGFLPQSHTSKSMERVGVEYFEELVSRSFFQHAPDDKSLFVMHDLMNDLATSVAGDLFSRLDIKMKKEVRKEGMEQYRHMSFVCEKYMVYKRFEACKGAKNLRTFLATSVAVKKSREIFFISNKILTDLLCELPLLRVLSLSCLNINVVPEFIGILKHLRYLNLSRTGITYLPDNVSNLYNLQTLIVFGCRSLKELPKSFSKLKNLQHFDMRDTPLLKKMPLGIGGLKSLRILSKFIIEGDNGFSITALKDLKDLQGKISIQGLDKVQSVMHAQEANLSQKRISELEFEWSDVFDDSQKGTHEKEVFNVLKPHNDSLKELGIVSYGGKEFPNWVGDPSFLRLAHVSINGCKNSTFLPPLGQLPSLKELFIEGMAMVKVVGPEFRGTSLAFPSLKILSFRDMKGWEAWLTNATFPCLEELSLDRCPNLVKISLETLPSLRVLRINRCGPDVLTNLIRVASSVTKLDIRHISGLYDQVWGGVLQCLGAVEELRIEWCNEIRHLWESDAKAGNILVNLRKLEVTYCSNLVSLGEKEEVNFGHGSNLEFIRIYFCKKMQHFSCPDSIESLSIFDCASVTSVSFRNGGKKLKSLSIRGCEKLLQKELINSSMQMLEYIQIGNCPNMTSIIQLSCFIHLTELEIKNCQNMESFPDHELPNLTFLKHLTIENCPSMDASFPRGLWPRNLCSLSIGWLKTPISEWGPQNFPISLVDLRLGGQSEDVTNFSQLSHLLPSSLTSLRIHGFEKLELVSVGLQHLTFLQHLSIYYCPNTIDLPGMLLTSLLSLTILRCPNLKERSDRRDSYWPLISLIPCIYIS